MGPPASAPRILTILGFLAASGAGSAPSIAIPRARAATLDDEVVYVDGKKAVRLVYEGPAWAKGSDCIEGSGGAQKVFIAERLGEGDFTIRARLALPEIKASGASIVLGENSLAFDGPGKAITGTGPWFGAKPAPLGDAAKLLGAKRPFEIEARRAGGKLTIAVDKRVIHSTDAAAGAVGKVGFVPASGAIRIYSFSIRGNLVSADPQAELRGATLQPKIDSAIDRGVKYLLSTQLRDGSWGSFEPMYHGGQTALSVYTLLKCGLSTKHPAVQRGLAYLEAVTPGETYTAAAMILAYEATHDPAWRPRIHAIAASLLAWVQGSGRFSYPNEHQGDHFGRNPGMADLSNTQFAALGLWAATRAGFEVAPEQWALLIDGILGFQERTYETDVPLDGGKLGLSRAYVGGFTYRAHEGFPNGSMTCAGASALKIAQLCAGAKLNRAVAKKVDPAVDAALGWLKVHYNVTANPQSGDWIKYYLYGLERTCALTGTSTIAGHDWYLEGAKYLVEGQGGRGDWYDRYGEPDTCFALLFLRRATSMVMTGGDATAGAPDLHVSESAADAVLIRATGAASLTMWVTGFGEGAAAARPADGADGAPGGVRVVSVEWLVNNKPIQKVAGNPNKAWSGERYAASHAFEKAGSYRVTARITALAAGAPAGASEPTVTLFAQGFTVETGPVLETWLLEAARLRTRNLLLGKDLTVVTSSQLSAGEGFDKATDGLEGTRWLCAAKDASPTLALELKQPVRADTVILSPCCMKDESRGIFDKIREVEVRVNREKAPIVAAMPEDEFRPVLVSLGKTVVVKQLEVRVTKRERGGSVPGSTGFSEVGLELREKDAK